MIVCTKCNESKDPSFFGKDSRKLNGLKSRCKKCSNRDAEDSKMARYSCDPVFREKTKIKKLELKTKDRVRQNENARKWQRNNPKRAAFNSAKYHAEKLQRTPNWLTETHFEQIQMFYDAAHDLTKEFGKQMEVDHIVPLRGENVSGLHVPWNLRIMSAHENLSKGNRFT